MQRSIDQRPKFTRRHRCDRISAEEPGTNLEKNPSTKTKPVGLRTIPWKGLELRRPRVLEPRQLGTGYAPGQKLTGDRLQAWLGGWRCTFVESVKLFAPPREPNGAEPRVTGRRYDVGNGEVEVPQRREGGTDASRQLLKRDLAVVVEPAISDSRRPSLPRPRRMP